MRDVGVIGLKMEKGNGFCRMEVGVGCVRDGPENLCRVDRLHKGHIASCNLPGPWHPSIVGLTISGLTARTL